MSSTSSNYSSDINYYLAQSPVGIEDPAVNEALNNLHNAIAILIREIESLKERVTALEP